LGCGECYKTFGKELESIFKNVQSSSRHNGKFPQKAGAEHLMKRELDKLRLTLAKAVESEEYEEAAKLRDRIRELEGGRA
jgi:protein arginine kinase activator